VDGQSTSALRVSLDAGALVLKNVQLKLDALAPLSQRLAVERAFAAELRVVIPWASLASEPLQVVLSGLDVVLVQQQAADLQTAVVLSSSAQAGVQEEEGGEDATALLLGAVNSFDVRVANACVTLRPPFGNGVLRLHCGSATAHNVPSQPEGLEDPQLEWLSKTLMLADVRVLAQHEERPPTTLLHIASCSVQAILPLFSASSSPSPFRVQLDVGRLTAGGGEEQLALVMSALCLDPSANAKRPDADVSPMSDHYAAALTLVLSEKSSLESRVEELESLNAALHAALVRQSVALELLADENAATLSG